MREFSEGVDRICRELEVNGAGNPSFHTDEFILKITVRKVTETEQKPNRNRTEKLPENDVRVAEKDGMVTENGSNVAEKLPVNDSSVAEKLPEKLTENINKLIEKLTEKASVLGETLTPTESRFWN